MNSILIRAEDKNEWERRTPIIPSDLFKLKSTMGAKISVQESTIRCFSNEEYEKSGAYLCRDFGEAKVVIGIKEVPEEKIQRDKVYMIFSHTIKGQKSNMKILKKFLSSGSTLIDYEKIIDSNNRRLIYFGHHAGEVGCIDILWLVGEHCHSRGIDTPLKDCRQTNQYKTLYEAKKHMCLLGEKIRRYGFSKSISPFVIGILGNGNVAKGVLQILKCLPIKKIKPNQLKELIEKKHYNPFTVYVVSFKKEDLVDHVLGKKFCSEEYYKLPQNYINGFSKYLQYLTIVINGVYWEERFPKFIRWDDLKNIYQNTYNRKLCGIADISCDIPGAIECTVKTTSIQQPAYLCNPITREIKDGHKGEGLVVLAVDNLPAELPIESSTFFSGKLSRFLPNILKANFNNTLEKTGLCPEIRNAVIVHNGKLTPKYKYLEKHI